MFVTGIGSGDERSTVQLGQLAQKAGAEAVLLPMPYFFPYSQPDLTATCEAVAAALDVPVLLYNLPQFSTGLQPETTLDLIRRCPTIVGIKDSSGSLDILRLLAETDVPARKIVGNDTVIRAALLEGVCDGAISGVACVLPELLARIFEVSAATSSPSEEFDRLCATLDLFIAQLDRLPTPWGLKVLAEVRGFGPPNFPLTLAGSRQEEVSALRNWFENHQTELLVR